MAHSKKVLLIRLVSSTWREIFSRSIEEKGWELALRKWIPARTPQRKSSPLGVRPIPTPIKLLRADAAFAQLYCESAKELVFIMAFALSRTGEGACLSANKESNPFNSDVFIASWSLYMRSDISDFGSSDLSFKSKVLISSAEKNMASGTDEFMKI